MIYDVSKNTATMAVRTVLTCSTMNSRVFLGARVTPLNARNAMKGACATISS